MDRSDTSCDNPARDNSVPQPEPNHLVPKPWYGAIRRMLPGQARWNHLQVHEDRNIYIKLTRRWVQSTSHSKLKFSSTGSYITSLVQHEEVKVQSFGKQRNLTNRNDTGRDLSLCHYSSSSIHSSSQPGGTSSGHTPSYMLQDMPGYIRFAELC